MKKFFLIFILTFACGAFAETLSIPEDCLAKETAPCLIKANENQILKSHSGAFAVGVEENTIFKITEFKAPYQFELLQGKISIFSKLKKPLAFKLNEVRFDSFRIFAEMLPERQMRVYDSRKFILSDYELPRAKGEETVIVKSEFLAKLDMIRYLSGYFSNKKSLISYLKAIEPSWKNEFQSQTDDQTMALKRSIASIEKEEAEAKRRQAEEIMRNKKVRAMFFYRTFYR